MRSASSSLGDYRVDGRRGKPFSAWGGGGGASRAQHRPSRLLDAEAGKSAGCGSCERENVLSVTARKSFLIAPGCDGFPLFYAARFVLPSFPALEPGALSPSMLTQIRRRSFGGRRVNIIWRIERFPRD